MNKIYITIALLLAVYSTVQAKTLGIYGNIENKLDSVVYISLCASDEEYLKAMENCQKKMSKNIRLAPGERKRVQFIVHWGGYNLHWKVITPQKGVTQQTGSELFVKGEAQVVVTE